MILLPDDVGGSSWIDEYNEREMQWRSGHASYPLDDFFRYEVPKVSFSGGQIPIEVIDALTRIDPTFEIVFDRFTTVGGGAGFHVCRRYEEGGSPASDRLRLEVSIQSELAKDNNLIWPRGGPCFPALWVANMVLKHYVGPLGGELNNVRRRMIKADQDKVLAQRAATVKRDVELERAAWGEVARYFPKGSIPGAKSQTITRNRGNTLMKERRKPVIVDMGAL